MIASFFMLLTLHMQLAPHVTQVQSKTMVISIFSISLEIIFLSLHIDMSGAYSFWPVCLSVHPFFHLFVCKNFYIGHIFWLVRCRAFIFHMSIPCDKTFLLVPSSRSSVKVKVKYQGQCFPKNGSFAGGISVSQTQFVFIISSTSCPHTHLHHLTLYQIDKITDLSE